MWFELQVLDKQIQDQVPAVQLRVDRSKKQRAEQWEGQEQGRQQEEEGGGGQRVQGQALV
jgi:hypothetical protein